MKLTDEEAVNMARNNPNLLVSLLMAKLDAIFVSAEDTELLRVASKKFWLLKGNINKTDNPYVKLKLIHDYSKEITDLGGL